jgi:hypothetical protein
MNWYHREPTLEEILSDSITRAVMEADGVDQKELEAMLSRVGRTALPLPTRARGWGPWSADLTTLPVEQPRA